MITIFRKRRQDKYNYLITKKIIQIRPNQIWQSQNGALTFTILRRTLVSPYLIRSYFGIFYFLFYCLSVYVNEWPGGATWCKVHAYLSILSCNISYILLTIISLDVCWVITKPFHYRSGTISKLFDRVYD